MRGFDVAPYVAAASQRSQARLRRQTIYDSSSANESTVAAKMPEVVAARPSAESAAQLSLKETKAALKKLNKERKKAPVVFHGAVFNARPQHAIAALITEEVVVSDNPNWAPAGTSAEATAVHATAPQATASQATAPQATAVHAIAPQDTDVQAAAPQATAVQATAPQATAVQATAPQATAVQATGTQATGTQATAVQATGIQAIAVQATAPQATAVQATAPQATAVQATAPHATAVQATAPQATAVQATGTPATAVQATLPRATYMCIAFSASTAGWMIIDDLTSLGRLYEGLS